MTDRKLSLSIIDAGIGDIEVLQAIEASAAQLFLESPYPELAGFEPFDHERYITHLKLGDPVFLGLVETETGQFTKAGFAVAGPLAGGLHLFELSVHTDWQGMGLGGHLLHHLQRRALQCGFGQITLTTYRSLPWNGPFYERMGFSYLETSQQPPEIYDLLQREIASGANAEDRCAMRWEA